MIWLLYPELAFAASFLLKPIEARCPTSALASLPLVLQYAVWRGWHQAVIYAPATEQGCKWAILRLVKCLGLNGVGAAVPVSKTASRTFTSLGVVILLPKLKMNSSYPLLELLSELPSYSWQKLVREFPRRGKWVSRQNEIFLKMSNDVCAHGSEAAGKI
ncbi:hypothetical protein EVAR_89060_1 [Eumeta japonica]|uniref:Uncharacterized protein n=1 Tax=Eumeta variegata TaxID=151549 RepID=A0A4C1XJH1_EUMVA|nr:hypothetical protein EVAR_89060_1 [Eumeta japonica]